MKCLKKIINFMLKHIKSFYLILSFLLFVPFIFTVSFGAKHIDIIRLADSDSDSDLLFMFQFGVLSASSLCLPLFVLLLDPLTDFIADFIEKHIISKPD